MNAVLSVVVPTFRRDELLKKCLDCLVSQRLDRSLFEIIVADDAASASTRRLVESYRSAGGPAVCYIPVVDRHGPAAARNVGWRAARGEVIAFTDDDCQPRADWLAAGWKAIGGADAATGRTVVPIPPRPTDHDRDTAGLSRAAFITANLFCRRDALENVGGFDENFALAWREDSDLHFALLERGMKIVVADHAVVVHPVRPVPWGISLRAQRRGVFDPLLYRKHPELYRRYIPPLPRYYYAATAGLALALAAAAVGRADWALGSLAVWLAITAWFAGHRLRGASKDLAHLTEMMVTSAIIPLLSVYWRVRGSLRYRAFYW